MNSQYDDRSTRRVEKVERDVDRRDVSPLQRVMNRPSCQYVIFRWNTVDSGRSLGVTFGHMLNASCIRIVYKSKEERAVPVRNSCDKG